MSVVHVYGLTEVYGPYTICEPQESWRELFPAGPARTMARQGVGMLQAESARVVDDEMRDVPADGRTLGEVEQALLSPPDVLDVAVVGVPHEKRGERPVAHAVRSSTSRVTEDELRDHAAQRLARFKVPDTITFPEALPRTATGRVRKNELRGG